MRVVAKTVKINLSPAEQFSLRVHVKNFSDFFCESVSEEEVLVSLLHAAICSSPIFNCEEVEDD